MIFLFLIQSIFAIDDSAANSLIQQEIQRSINLWLDLVAILIFRCKTYAIHHETCVDNIRSSFEARYNVPVTCAFTSDSETVYGNKAKRF